MFGFLNGPRTNTLYRQIYACCCSSLRDRFGYRSLPFVSYEAIFAHALAVDRRLIPPPSSDAVTCCKTRRRYSKFRADVEPAVTAALQFNSSFAMLLAEVKLNDDVQDAGSRLARLGRRILRKPILRSREFLSRHEPHFDTNLSDLLKAHAAMERSGNPIDLDEYTAPTGDAFALVFGILPAVVADASDRQRCDDEIRFFRSAGRLVGQSLIAFDCAVDFEADRRRGHFNPLATTRDVDSAFAVSQRKLVELGWLLGQPGSAAGDPESVSQSVLRHRITTIGFRRRQVERTTAAPASDERSRARRPFLLPPRLQRGFCDCDCDCGGCDGCGSSVGSCFDCLHLPSRGLHFLGNCCCEAPADLACSAVCDPLCGADKTKSKSTDPGLKDTPIDSLEAGPKTAEVVVQLSPYGTVRVDGETSERAAKSDCGMIEAGESVLVIRKEAFGLLVRRTPKIPGSPGEPVTTE